MAHMVIYRGTDGKPGYHQTEDIHDAVSFVEQLRNDDGVEHARIFRLEEVAFEYRPYFRVELRAGDAALGAAPAQPAVAAGTSERPVSPAAETSSTSAPPPVAGGESATPSAAPATPTPSPAPATSAPAPSAPAEPAPATTETATPPSPSTDTPAQESGPDSSSGGDNGVGARRGLFGR